MERYEMGRAISANVYIGTHKASSRAVVLKKLAVADGGVSEISAGRVLRHPNIITLQDSFYDRQEKVRWAVFDLVEGKDLFNHMKFFYQWKPLSEMGARKYFLDIVAALQYMHGKHIAHLDIKPENIMVETKTGRAILIDFGLCYFVGGSDEKCARWSGSQSYAAPQIFLKIPYNPYAADIWSLGVVLYVLLNGELPFAFDDMCALLQFARRMPSIEFNKQCVASTQARALICGMLEMDEAKRLTLDQIISDPWVVTVSI